MPDRDEFINVTKSTRTAVAAVNAWLDAPSDEAPLLVERVLSNAVNATGGVPGYVGALCELLGSLASAPLLTDPYQAADSVDEFFAARGTNLLDKLLQQSITSSVVSGVYDPNTVIAGALVHAAEALIVDARGGVLSSRGTEAVDARRDDLRRCFQPAAENISRKLQNNEPGATIRTRLPDELDVYENLLGGKVSRRNLRTSSRSMRVAACGSRGATRRRVLWGGSRLTKRTLRATFSHPSIVPLATSFGWLLP